MSVYNNTPGNAPPPTGPNTTARISPAADGIRTSSSRNLMKINLTDKFRRTATAPPQGTLADVTTTIEPVTPTHPAFDHAAALFDEYRAHYGHPRSPQATASWLRDQLDQHRITAAAAIHADQVRGLITVVILPASLTLSTAWSIRDLYVPPNHRRTGTARALLHHVIDNARTAGALRVSLQTETDNHTALKLYTDLGFHPVTGLELLNLPLH